MQRPSMYSTHDRTMLEFAELFNRCPLCSYIEMRPNPEETFDNDGIFIDVQSGIAIGYDWEYRDRYFANGKLEFHSLGQYERKLRKPSIQLSLQCDSTETSIAVGWHNDWLREEQEKRELLTDYEEKEQGTVRYTTHFRIYRYQEMNQFKRMIAQALFSGEYSSNVF